MQWLWPTGLASLARLNALVWDKVVHTVKCMLNLVQHHHNPKLSRHRPNKPFTFFGSQCRFWTLVSCSARHIAALFVRCIPIFQYVSDAIIKTFKLISHAGSVWVTAEWLWHLYRRSRWRRQILRHSCLAKWCPQNFLCTSSTNTHTCHETSESCIHVWYNAYRICNYKPHFFKFDDANYFWECLVT